MIAYGTIDIVRILYFDFTASIISEYISCSNPFRVAIICDRKDMLEFFAINCRMSVDEASTVNIPEQVVTLCLE